MNPPEVAADQMPRVWAALIEQGGQLFLVAVQFVIAQHLYATYLAGAPESSWLRKGFDWYRQRQTYKRAAQWVNSEKEVELVGS